MVGLLPQRKKMNLGSITLTNKASSELSYWWEHMHYIRLGLLRHYSDYLPVRELPCYSCDDFPALFLFQRPLPAMEVDCGLKRLGSVHSAVKMYKMNLQEFWLWDITPCSPLKEELGVA
jgi:hypothetical protein